MTRCYKYALSTDNPGQVTAVVVQKHSKVLCGKMQNDWPTFWFAVNPDQTETETWALAAVYHGQDLPEGMNEDTVYCGTEFSSNGLVWHFFARRLNYDD